MKLGELLHRELRSRYVVYICNEESITNYERLFDGFFDPTSDEEVMEWKRNFHKYFDYEVVYFFADLTNSPEYLPYNSVYTKIVITKPEDEELPF